MAARVNTPGTVKWPIELTVSELARLVDMSRRMMHRRLKAAGVVLRPRGTGTQRKHVVVTLSELRANPEASWILDEIEWREQHMARKRPRTTADDDNSD